MNMPSALNNGFLFLALGAVFVGLVKLENFRIREFAPFLLFFVFFRIKMWLDDADYFSQEPGGTRSNNPGCLVRICRRAISCRSGRGHPCTERNI
jgi:hypothetical protein